MEAWPSAQDPDIQRRLRRATRDALLPLTLALAFLYSVFAIQDFLTVPPRHHKAVLAADLFGVVANLTLHGVLRRSSSDLAFKLGFVVAAVATATTASTTFVTGDPAQAAGFLLVVLGTGVVLLDLRWCVASWALSTAALTAAIVRWDGDAGLLQIGGLTLAAVLIGAVVLRARMRLMTCNVTLQRAQHGQARALRVALAHSKTSSSLMQTASLRLERIVDALFDGVLVHDGSRVLASNKAVERLAGRQLEGHPVAEAVTAPFSLAQEFGPRDAILVGAMLGAEGGASGKPTPVEVRSRSVDWDGKPAWLLVLRDTSDAERERKTAELAREREQEVMVLRQADRFRTEFMNMASHELRTPLTPIMLQVEVLRRLVGTSPEANRRLDVLERNLQRLNRLVNDILDSARLQVQRLHLHPMPTDLQELLSEELEAYAEASRHADVRIDMDLEPVEAEVDGGRIHQVVANLLSNALKFTPAGGRVGVRLRRDGDHAVIEVHDTGAGIDPAQHDRLFRPFSQLTDHQTMTQPGAGLGLYVSHGIVTAHGGTLTAHSNGLGQGTTFTLRLPRKAAPQPTESGAAQRRTAVRPALGAARAGARSLADGEGGTSEPSRETRTEAETVEGPDTGTPARQRGS